MAGSHHNGEEEGYQRSQESNMVRVLTQYLFRYLDHPVHTAGSLQSAGAGYGRNDYIDNVRRRRAGLEAESEHQDCKADSGNGAKRKGTVAGTHIQSCKNDEQLYYHDKAHKNTFSAFKDSDFLAQKVYLCTLK